LQNLTGIFFGFNTFFLIIIFSSLFIKFKALLNIQKNISVWHVLPYLFVLSFLHEGIQVRIALALSIGLWAIIFYARKNYVLAIIILLIASTFHITVLTFLLVAVTLYLYQCFKHRFIYLAVFFTLLFSFTSFLPDALHALGRMTNARFMSYSEGFYEIQNKSGLFQYFFVFVGVLTAFVWRYDESKTELWRGLKHVGVASGCLAVSILLVFGFNVVLSSRLADLLLLPLLLVLGSTLSQLRDQRRWVLLGGMTFTLVFYGILRWVVSFKPQIIQGLSKQLSSFL
jgi:hypothetical protein